MSVGVVDQARLTQIAGNDELGRLFRSLNISEQEQQQLTALLAQLSDTRFGDVMRSIESGQVHSPADLKKFADGFQPPDLPPMSLTGEAPVRLEVTDGERSQPSPVPRHIQG